MNPDLYNEAPIWKWYGHHVQLRVVISRAQVQPHVHVYPSACRVGEADD